MRKRHCNNWALSSRQLYWIPLEQSSSLVSAVIVGAKKKSCGNSSETKLELKRGYNLQYRMPFHNIMYSSLIFLHAGFGAQDKHC